LLTAVLLGPGTANAEPASPISARELAQIIREAGYDCRDVEKIEVPTSPAPGWENFRPTEVVLCNNGKKFLVTKSGRGGGNARPVVRQLPGGAHLQFDRSNSEN